MRKRLALPAYTGVGYPYRDSIKRLPEPSIRVIAPAWSEDFAAELAYCEKVAQAFIADRGYPTVSMDPWLVLAIVRQLATVTASNEALRHFRAETR